MVLPNLIFALDPFKVKTKTKCLFTLFTTITSGKGYEGLWLLKLSLLIQKVGWIELMRKLPLAFLTQH